MPKMNRRMTELLKKGYVKAPETMFNPETGNVVITIGDQVIITSDLKTPVGRNRGSAPRGAFVAKKSAYKNADREWRPTYRARDGILSRATKGGTLGIFPQQAVLKIKEEPSTEMDKLGRSLESIRKYSNKQLNRMNLKGYDAVGLRRVKALIAVNIGHMILNIDNKSIPAKVLDEILKPYGTTFKEIERCIDSDHHF
ncbi:hypothetical protein PMSM_13335 [Paenibacillus macquariensis subsp. macquariensis]|nr:hypothetical protein PMSM_13335 [Paenibacillus macquariensis subsp. macquariensis]